LLFKRLMPCILLFAWLMGLASAQTNSLAAVGIEENHSVEELNADWAAVLSASWGRHVAQRLSRLRPGTEEFEGICRSGLRHDMLSAGVVTNLVRHFFQRGEYVMAVATAAYGESIGVKTRSQRLSSTWTRLKEPFHDEDDHLIYVKSRMEQMGPVEQLKIPFYTPDFFTHREGELRHLLKHELEVTQLLYLLAETFHIRPEPHMALVMTTALIQLEPYHKKGLPLHLELLDESNRDASYQVLISYYVGMKDRPPWLDKKLGKVSLRLNAHKEAQIYFSAWHHREPENPHAMEKLATVLYRQRLFDQAKTLLIRASVLPDRDPEVFHMLALIAAHEGDAAEMAQWLSELRPYLDEDAFLGLLESTNFRRFPQLLGLIN
jgi:tetratricopeptide (TPR) repeat protein